MNAFVKHRYYLSSIFNLLLGFSNPIKTIAIFLGVLSDRQIEVRLRRNGWRFRIRSAMDAWIIKETCIDRDYLWACKIMQPEWTVVDIGAGLGDFTVFAAKFCSEGIVHAYEPLDDSFSLLTQNAKLNGLANVRPFRKAVSAVGGVFSVDRSPGTEAVSTRFREGPGESEVPAVALRQILDALPGERCDFLKIDCEGCEFDLLMKSPVELLDRIDRISLEFHENDERSRAEDLVSYLQQRDFQVQTKANPVHSHLGFLYAQRRHIR